MRKLVSLSIVLLCAALLAFAPSAQAAPCKRICKPAIQRCVAAGNRRLAQEDGRVV